MISNVSERLAQTLSDYVDRTTEVDYIRYGIEVLIRGSLLHIPSLYIGGAASSRLLYQLRIMINDG